MNANRDTLAGFLENWKTKLGEKTQNGLTTSFSTNPAPGKPRTTSTVSTLNRMTDNSKSKM